MSHPLSGISLSGRIQSTVLALTLISYLVGLLVIGLPLRGIAIDNLDHDARRELGGLRIAIQDYALLRDYPAIEQVLSQRVGRSGSEQISYSRGALSITKVAPRSKHAYPAWFAQLLHIASPHERADIVIGGVNYGSLSVSQSPLRSIENIWTLIIRFTLLMIGGMVLVSAIVRTVLTANLRGLYSLQKAAHAFERGDFGARVVIALKSPPELRETQLAFNHMAQRLSDLLATLKSRQDELHNEKERLRVTIESIGDAVVVTDATGHIEFINPRALELTGLDPNTAMGRRVADAIPMVSEESGAIVTSPLELALRRNRVIALDNHTAILRPDGTRIAIRDTAAPIRTAMGQVQGGVLVFQDETERRKLMQRLIWQAERDHLTGLYNRREMEVRMATALKSVQGRAGVTVFCYMDVDRFKLVNDTSGHQAGDALLQRITAILLEHVKETRHCLGRLGGDEFGFLFTDTGLDEALLIVQRLRDEISRCRFEWEGQAFRLSASFGVTELQATMRDIGEILAQSSTACYHAKSLGGDAIQVYEYTHPALRKITNEMQWVVIITRAFEEHRFALYRQKVLNLNPVDATQHYEVLLRMRTPEGGIVPPGEFLPAAERYGLAPSFDRWVIRNLLAYMDTHPADKACYAINLSGRSLSDPAFGEFIFDTLDQHGVEPTRICFEITETAAIDNMAECERLILKMKSRGIYFALDDFGKGQSSFGYLQRLQVKYIKIDGEFIRGIDHKPENFAITKAIHTLAHDLQKLTIAEQAETEAELACIKRLGINFVQGYLLHEPEPIPMGDGGNVRNLRLVTQRMA